MRHRVEHLGLCTVDQIARAAKFNLALSFFVCHLYFYAKTYTEHIFGAERTNRWTPLSEATKHGIRWSIHQDHATFPGPPLPFANLKTAVTRTHRDDRDTIYGPEYCVSIHEAMKAVTIDAAWQIHKDDILGSLTKNKKADLLILSKNPYEVMLPVVCYSLLKCPYMTCLLSGVAGTLPLASFSFNLSPRLPR